MVLPVGAEGDAQVLKIIDKDLEGKLKEVDSFGVRYIPLTSREAQLR